MLRVPVGRGMSFEQVVPLAQDTVNWTNFVGLPASAWAEQTAPAAIAAATMSDVLNIASSLSSEGKIISKD